MGHYVAYIELFLDPLSQTSTLVGCTDDESGTCTQLTEEYCLEHLATAKNIQVDEGVHGYLMFAQLHTHCIYY